MLDKFYSEAVNDMKNLTNSTIPLEDIPHLKETNSMRMRTTELNMHMPLINKIVTDLMHKHIIVVSIDIIIKSHSEHPFFMFLKRVTSKRNQSPSQPLLTAFFYHHLWRNEPQRVQDKVSP